MPNVVPQAVIDEMKLKFPKAAIKIADLPTDDSNSDFLSVLVKTPSRQAVSQYQLWMDKNMNRANEFLVNDAVLTDKETVKADDALFMAAVDAIAQLIPARKAILKNC